jgi:hypothetical protein
VSWMVRRRSVLRGGGCGGSWRGAKGREGKRAVSGVQHVVCCWIKACATSTVQGAMGGRHSCWRENTELHRATPGSLYVSAQGLHVLMHAH